MTYLCRTVKLTIHMYICATTGCPIILDRSVHLSYYSGSDNNYGTPCILLVLRVSQQLNDDGRIYLWFLSVKFVIIQGWALATPPQAHYIRNWASLLALPLSCDRTIYILIISCGRLRPRRFKYNFYMIYYDSRRCMYGNKSKKKIGWAGGPCCRCDETDGVRMWGK